MADETQLGAGGAPEAGAGGAALNEGNPAPELLDGLVKRETFEKVLKERKKDAEKVRELSQKLAEMEATSALKIEEELRKKNDTEGLLKRRDEELVRLRADKDASDASKQQLEKLVHDSVKMTSFRHELGGSVGEQYQALLQPYIDRLPLDPETMAPDQVSLKTLVADFKSKYGMIIQGAKLPGVPAGAAQPGGGGTLTYDQWLALPLAEKKKRYGEIVRNETRK